MGGVANSLTAFFLYPLQPLAQSKAELLLSLPMNQSLAIRVREDLLIG